MMTSLWERLRLDACWLQEPPRSSDEQYAGRLHARNGDDIYKWVGPRIRVSFPSDTLRLSKWNHKHDLQKKATEK